MAPKARGPPSLDRTPSAHSRSVTEGVWCFERAFEGQEKRPPVRLVVFDWDETLTLSTFLPADQGLRTKIGWCEWAEYITLHNFETPFVQTKGRTRVEKLRALFAGLVGGDGEAEPVRTLAILTRNNQGVIACLNLLMMAGLSEHFSAIWCMANVTCGIPNSAYRGKDGGWVSFTAPFKEVYDHKADVLVSLCADPAAWFPQLAEGPHGLEGLRPEEIVLVDDVRTNFQSPSPKKPKVVRYCKVARYDCHYRELGFRSDMGGIGAKTDSDYDVLLDFVRQPWQYKAVLKARCVERHFHGCEDMPRVDLVVFDFDETLTLHTWMPEDRRCAAHIGYRGTPQEKQHYVMYNFASPYVEWDRVAKLREMLRDLAEDPLDGQQRLLAVLTKNEEGAVAVLNLLMMAGLDSHFSAVWALGAGDSPGGVFRDSSEWRIFKPPFGSEPEHCCKAEVLRGVVAEPRAWFPQFTGAQLMRLKGMTLASVVLVDDEPANFRAREGSEEEDEGIVRHCEVTRYEDDSFRDQGLVTHMGGLGAKTDEDFSELLTFVRSPWLYRERQAPPEFRLRAPTEAEEEVPLVRRHTQEELDTESGAALAATRRTKRALTMPCLLKEEVAC